MIWVLTAVLMLTLEIGLATNARLMVTGAAREGARRAAIDGGNSPAARLSVERYLALSGMDPSKARVNITPGTASYGTQVTVLVEVDYDWRSPLVRRLLGRRMTIRGEAASRSEKVRAET